MTTTKIPHLVRNDFWVREVSENATHFRNPHR
jgi:hypothetical protein